MQINHYCCSVHVVLPENPIVQPSVWDKLEKQGDNLIKPYRNSSGGRRIIIAHPDVAFSFQLFNCLKNTYREGTRSFPLNKKLTFKEIAEVGTGLMLKRVAALFSKKIRAKYELIDKWSCVSYMNFGCGEDGDLKRINAKKALLQEYANIKG